MKGRSMIGLSLALAIGGMMRLQEAKAAFGEAHAGEYLNAVRGLVSTRAPNGGHGRGAAARQKRAAAKRNNVRKHSRHN